MYKQIRNALSKLTTMLRFKHGIKPKNDLMDLPAKIGSQYIDLVNKKYKIDKNDEKNIEFATAIYLKYYENTFTIPGQRLTVQTIFLTVNTIFSSTIGYILLNYKSLLVDWSVWLKISYFTLPYFIILSFCYIWFRILDEYEVLSDSFIMLARAMEENLPVRPLTILFDVNKQHEINHSLGTLGKALPTLFSLLYLSMFIYLLTT